MHPSDPEPTLPPRAQRLLRGLWRLLRSGGRDGWRALRLVLAVARLAPTYAEGDILLVPGYRLAYDAVPRLYSLRLKRALRLWRPSCRLLLSGYAATAGSQSEALAGYVYLRDHGLPAGAAIDLDGAARDTAGNLLDTRRRLGPGARLLIVSNRWHLARCLLLARAVGLRARGCAAERRLQLDAATWLALLREAVLLLGDTDEAAILCSPKSLLDPEP